MAGLSVTLLKVLTFISCVTFASTACNPQQTMINQGTELCCYNDSTGAPSIGTGFHLERTDATIVMADYNLTVSNILEDCQNHTAEYCLTVNQAEDLFYRVLYREATVCADNYVPNLSKETRAAVIDVASATCRTLNTFVKMKTALENRNWTGAAQELRNSHWCEQVKQYRCNLDYDCILNANTARKLESFLSSKICIFFTILFGSILFFYN
jgi:hypothetical protein